MNYNLTIFYDYLCPFCHRIVEWLDKIEQSGRVELSVEWKVLSLEQINQKQGEGFKVWENPLFPSRGIPALAAAKAAQRQGTALFNRFHRLVFEACHRQGRDISKRPVLVKAAQKAGLDVQLFERDLDLKENLEAIGKDYQEARQCYNLFGAPTLVFENDEAIYVKIESVPETEEGSIKLLEQIFQMGLHMPYLLELKRP